MTIKERLREIRDLTAYIDDLQAKADELHARVTSPANAPLSHVQIHSRDYSDKVGDMVAKLSDMYAEINRKIDQLIDKRREIDVLVAKLPAREQRLIYLRYYNGLSWERIAVEMNYTYRQITRIHGDCLQALQGL